MAIYEKKINETVSLYYEDIYKFCCAKCRNADVAADLTHETFCIFLCNCKKLEDNNLQAYLFTTAYNLIQAQLRRQSIEQTFVKLDDCEIVIPDNTVEVMSEEEFEQLLDDTKKKILKILTPSERELFIKLYIEKKSVTLVAKETGLTENNIYVKSHRLKKKAKDLIFTGKLLIAVVSFKLFSQIM